jgi:hypothetical protein
MKEMYPLEGEVVNTSQVLRQKVENTFSVLTKPKARGGGQNEGL